MVSNTGIDPLRGRPTPGIASTEEKIQKRKIDSLKRGVHRVKDASNLPLRLHVVGIGSAGAASVEKSLSCIDRTQLTNEGSIVNVLVIDVGENSSFDAIRRHSMRLAGERAHIEILQLEVPTKVDLTSTLERYPEFLRLEYPFSNSADGFEPWLNANEAHDTQASPSRALAKAIYGQAYYDGERPAATALSRFAKNVSNTPGESLVSICFGIGGSTSSGIVMDLARHLSNIRFGRRILVAGVGIGPCDGDAPRHVGAHIFPVLNELDCMSDELLNQGAVTACGDLYRNPFTAGFLYVPQQHVWEATRSLPATHARVDSELASLITERNGANFWEALRLLNWIAAPATQHSASRTQYGKRWIHMFGFADVDTGDIPIEEGFLGKIGLLPTYRPEFVEARTSNGESGAGGLAARIESAFHPSIKPVLSEGGHPGSVQFILPQIRKNDLRIFGQSRTVYDTQDRPQKVGGHSWLLEHGVILCEPSTTFQGMAGASLGARSRWIQVPYVNVRGDESPSAIGSLG